MRQCVFVCVMIKEFIGKGYRRTVENHFGRSLSFKKSYRLLMDKSFNVAVPAPKTTHTQDGQKSVADIIKKVSYVVLDDRRLKVREIAHTVGISTRDGK